MLIFQPMRARMNKAGKRKDILKLAMKNLYCDL